MVRLISLTVNGRAVDVEEGATCLDAARQAGVHIPKLCYYARLPTHAVCRMCLVHVAGQPHLQPACITLAKAGDMIETASNDLPAFRAMDAQWLLARHPNDCLRCEVNGSCRLQSLISENQWEERWEKMPRGSVAHPEHRLTDHTSPSIWRDLSKCIECGLCAEACGTSGQQQYVIGFAERGGGRAGGERRCGEKVVKHAVSSMVGRQASLSIRAAWLTDFNHGLANEMVVWSMLVAPKPLPRRPGVSRMSWYFLTALLGTGTVPRRHNDPRAV